MNEVAVRRLGADYWLIVAGSLIWNGLACYDLTMVVTRDPDYLSKYPRDVTDWYDSAPTWTLLPWALGVWGALAGSLLLLARSRAAVPAFAWSLAGLMIFLAWELYVGPPASMDMSDNYATTATVRLIAAGLLWYAIDQRRRGILR